MQSKEIMKIKPTLIHGWLLAAFLILPAAVQAQFDFTTNDDGSLNISGYTGPGGAVVTPSTTNGLPVTSIGYQVFYYNDSITSVSIPDSITSLGSFYFCTSLTNITIGNGVTSITGETFTGCSSLSGATIGNSVTNIGSEAFYGCASLTDITIPASVIFFTNNAFFKCTSLTAITVDAQNPVYSSVNGVLFDKSQTTLIEFPEGVGSSYTIPNGVTDIEDDAFFYCSNLTSSIIPGSVTNIESEAFGEAGNPFKAYFNGPAPTVGSEVFLNDDATVYYLPGTKGWGTTLSGAPTALWFLSNPLILNNGPGFGVQTNRFDFTISWATNLSVIVEACTNLANPIWSPVATNRLTSGVSFFSDPQRINNYSGRFYRISSMP